MALKTYGIFIAYSPGVEMKGQGLGRYLAEFIRAVITREESRLVIATPSWSRQALIDLFDEMGISKSDVEILSPHRQPIIVSLLGRLRKQKKTIKQGKPEWYGAIFRKLKRHSRKVSDYFCRAAATVLSSRNLGVLIIGFIPAFLIISFSFVLFFLYRLVRRLRNTVRRALRWINAKLALNALVFDARRALSNDRTGRVRLSISSFLSKLILDRETERLTHMVDDRDDVASWYIPTPLWPLATKIQRPTLICVPDVVTSEFPMGFGIFGANTSRAYDDIRETLRNGRHFVTYSEHIKDTVLIDKFSVDSNRISVIPHASSRLDKFIIKSGFQDNNSATRSLHKAFFLRALTKANGVFRPQNFNTNELSYIFYASQARPSKNILSLLRAYEYLLRKKYIKTKLVLTAHGDSPEIATFVKEHDLGRDVLCLYDLSEIELAACYSLADLAVCPTLSEGGMPFTFTEALSVGTPVVMGRIAVTEEVMTDEEIQAITLFNPHDWKEMAQKIEWALANKAFLYEKQRAYYDDVLSLRSWDNVVSEHMEIMDRLSLDGESRVESQSGRRLA